MPDTDRLAERLLEHRNRLFSGQGVGPAELDESRWVIGKDELGSGFGDVIRGDVARRRFALAEDDDLPVGPVELGFRESQISWNRSGRRTISRTAELESARSVATFPLPSGVFADSAWRMLSRGDEEERPTSGALRRGRDQVAVTDEVDIVEAGAFLAGKQSGDHGDRRNDRPGASHRAVERGSVAEVAR